MMTVEEAVAGRRSIRAFLPKPVPRELIERVLTIAGRAPSGSNVQPWQVWVLQGAVRDEICREAVGRYDRGEVGEREYNYYPVKWREPYLARRRACGWGLYGTLGIGREDKDKMHAQHARNFAFFDAPVGLDLLHRPRPGEGLLARLRHVPAVDHGGRAPVRPRDLPAGRLAHLLGPAAAPPRHPAPTRRWSAAWRSATRTRTRR